MSLEDTTGAKHQPPIQFSFTLYDVDGCGKITKDDIAGIVSTIYENIGNTVLVPHFGKKTINVKLTVAPELKCQQKTSTNEQIHQNRAEKKAQLAPMRRNKPLVLLSDDEDDGNGSESMSENLLPLPKMQNKTTTRCKKMGKTIDKNNVYESINSMKCSNQSHTIENMISTKNIRNIEIYENCEPNQLPGRLHIKEDEEFNDRQNKASSKRKVFRKSKSKRQRVSNVIFH